MAAKNDATRRFEELYRALSTSILAYAARRTASPHDAADVMAETFAVAWRRIDDVPEGDEARPWMYCVARRVLANHDRGNRRRHRLSARVTSQLDAAVVTSVEVEVDPVVAAALASIDEPDRELLMLLAWDDLSREAVAQILDCSTATLRVRLHRARSRFRAALETRERSSGNPAEPVLPPFGAASSDPAALTGTEEVS